MENKFHLLGFNSYASNILCVLLNGDVYAVREIYEKTKIPKNKIYETLDFLKSKGIVGEENGSPKKYFIINHNILDSLIEDKESELETLKCDLEELKTKREKINPSVLSMIEGDDEIHKLIEYSNLSVKNEIMSCSSLTKMYYGCFRTLKTAIERGVKVKFVARYNGKNYNILKSYHDLGIQIRIYNSKKIFPKIGLFDDKYVRVTIYNPKLKSESAYKTIWANSSILHEIVKNHFNKLWEESEPFDPKNYDEYKKESKKK